jgi:hypothetical protein
MEIFQSNQKENRRRGRNMSEEWTEPKYLNRLLLIKCAAKEIREEAGRERKNHK